MGIRKKILSRKRKHDIMFVHEKTLYRNRRPITWLEITADNRLIISGERWKEKKDAQRLPIYGSIALKCKTKREALSLRTELVKIIKQL